MVTARGCAVMLLAQLCSTVTPDQWRPWTPETPAPKTELTDRVKQFLHVIVEPRSYLNAICLVSRESRVP